MMFKQTTFSLINCSQFWIQLYHRNAYWFIFQIRVRLRKLTQMSACEQVLIGAYIASLSVAVPFPSPPNQGEARERL